MSKSISGINKDKVRGTFIVQKQYRGITIKKRGFATLNDAKTYLARQIYLIDHPEELERKKDITLNELFNKYIEYRETKARITTIDGEVRRYKNHIDPSLGKLKTSELTQDIVHTWRINLVKRQMTDNFTNKIISTLRHTLTYGQTHDYIINVKCFNELEKAKLKTISKERDILTYDEIDQFLNTFEREIPREYDYWLYFYALSRSGMRPNEFRALQVKDIQGDYLVVNKTINSKDEHHDILLPPKNINSNRKVLMPHDIIELLLEYTKGYKPDNFIFGKDKAFRETNLKRELIKHYKAAGLNPIVMYGFRHSHATNLIKSGVPIKVVSKRLGHSNASTTMNVYWHLFSDDENQVIDILKSK